MIVSIEAYRFNKNVPALVSKAYDAGLNVPQYYFNKDFDIAKEYLEDKEIIDGGILKMIKPKGVDFIYSLYWTGTIFRGG